MEKGSRVNRNEFLYYDVTRLLNGDFILVSIKYVNENLFRGYIQT